jgi:hypothetical protein
MIRNSRGALDITSSKCLRVTPVLITVTGACRDSRNSQRQSSELAVVVSHQMISRNTDAKRKATHRADQFSQCSVQRQSTDRSFFSVSPLLFDMRLCSMTPFLAGFPLRVNLTPLLGWPLPARVLIHLRQPFPPMTCLAKINFQTPSYC